MPSSRYTPSAYGDIDSGGWDNPLPRPHRCKVLPLGPRYRGRPPPSSDPDEPGSWGHDMCLDCGYIENTRSRIDTAPVPISKVDQEVPLGRGQLRAPSTESDNWSPAPTRQDPVRIEPPQHHGNTNNDNWAPTPASNDNDDGGGWDAPAPAPPAPSSRSNGNGNGNGSSFSAPQPRAQHGNRSRYDDEDEDYINEEDEMIPPLSTEPVHGAYVAWTGVTYSDPAKNVADPPSLAELLEVLEPMRIERERRQAMRDGTALPGGSSRDCFNCGKPGHISADCQEPKKPREGGGGGGACYECGEEGHQSRDCPSKAGEGGGGGGCFNCGEDGHFSRECPNEKVEREGYGGGGRLCYNCGEDGHLSRDCVNEKVEGLGGGGGGGGSCYNCGEAGHFSRECPNEKVEREGGGGYGGGSMSCYNCGEEGHMSRDCVNERVAGAGGGGGTCYNCGEAGHMSRDCTEPPVPGSFRGECHNCGERGHQSRECEKPRVPGSFRGECHNCGETGHQSRECEKPRNYDRGADSGGGGDDWGMSEPVASGWEGEESTPALMADTSAGDDWGTPQSTIQTPAANSGWNRSEPQTSKTQDDEWGSPAPSAPPKQSNDNWGTPTTQESRAPPRATPAIHPSRLAMLGGKGAAAEYSSPSRANTKGPPPRELPPHMKASHETGNGYGHGNGAERPIEQPRMMKEEPKVIPVENNEFGGW